MVEPGRPTLLARTAPSRRARLGGPLGWLLGAVGPAAPAAVLWAVPSAEVLPGFLFLILVIGVTMTAGRGPGLLAAAGSSVTLGLVIASRPTPIAGWWVWVGVFLALCLLAVVWLDQLLCDATRRAAAVLDPLVEASPIGIALLDRELRFVRVNSALTTLSRIPPAAHVGRTLDEISPNLPRGLRDKLDAVLTTGTTIRNESVTIAPPDQPTKRLVIDAFPVRPTGGPNGPITGLGVVITDVTELHRLQELEHEAAQLRATAELGHRLCETQRLAGLVGYEYDNVTRTTTWSAEMCALLGRAEAPPVGDRSYHHPDEDDRITSMLRTTLATGAPFTIQTRMLHTDGHVLEVLLHGEGIQTPDGEVTGMWGVLQDLTEARAAQRALFATQQAMEQAWEAALADRHLMARFQRAQLPADLPRLPGATVVAEYYALADRMDIGGDWYDAFALPDGRIALSIGDVIGHDLQAAAIMGQIRAVARGYAITDPDPGSVLTRLNRLLSLTYPRGVLISAVAGLYDPTSGLLTWANAGHPHPLLAHPADRGATLTVLEHAEPILGVVNELTYLTQQVTLSERSTLLCYTDGLIEHHAGDMAAGEARLRTLLVNAVTGPEPAPAEHILHLVRIAMHADGPPEDDVCVLVLQRTTSRDPVRRGSLRVGGRPETTNSERQRKGPQASQPR